MSDALQPATPGGEFILYQTEDGRTRLDVRFRGDTVWLTQAQMADLFQRERSVITKHVRNIFAEGELVKESVCANVALTAGDGKTYQVELYNLDVIISVGYRVKSPRGTKFRIWATQRLREYIVKGFTMDDERLKQPPGPGVPDYFDEQVFLNDWRTRLDDFLRFNERAVLPGAGTVSREEADRLAYEQYGEFEDRRRPAAEQAGEADAISELEQTAKRVEKLKPVMPKRTKRGKA